MRLAAMDILTGFQGSAMFVSLLAAASVLASAQDAPSPAPPGQYQEAMRCAGVMAAISSLHAFTGNVDGKSRSDRNGRGFVAAAAGFAQPLGLTRENLAEAFSASTAEALGRITRNPDPVASAAAVDQLNADHDACLAIARGWVAAANGTS